MDPTWVTWTPRDLTNHTNSEIEIEIEIKAEIEIEIEIAIKDGDRVRNSQLFSPSQPVFSRSEPVRQTYNKRARSTSLYAYLLALSHHKHHEI
jgi:hypothetical protein